MIWVLYGNVYGLAKVSGYCRVRPYEGCATQNEIDVGLALRLNRPATADECVSYMLRPLIARRKLEERERLEARAKRDRRYNSKRYVNNKLN